MCFRQTFDLFEMIGHMSIIALRGQAFSKICATSKLSNNETEFVTMLFDFVSFDSNKIIIRSKVSFDQHFSFCSVIHLSRNIPVTKAPKSTYSNRSHTISNQIESHDSQLGKVNSLKYFKNVKVGT